MSQDDSIRERKKACRRAVLGGILAMNPGERRRQENVLADRFPSLPGYEAATTVLLYVAAFPEEIATAGLLAGALAAGKRVVLPRVDRRERRLRLFHVADPEAELRPGTLGILEPRVDLEEIAPAAIDWALVPGLAFDDRANRLGRGAGHYDRLLPMLRAGVPCWALALGTQRVERLPLEPHDRPLSGICWGDA